MRIFSTFSGIGGFEIGIQGAYMQSKAKQLSLDADKRSDNSDLLQGAPSCVGYSEIDKYAIKVYERNFPNVRNYGDITAINADTLPDFDCLVGGFPCQAFSIAGKRKGFEDTRGTLFFDLARILRAKQPRLCVFENVKGLLSHDGGRTFKTIIATIDELGYDCQWQVLNSKNFGVPQNRERVYIVGHLRGTPRPEVFPLGGTDGEDIEQVNNARHDYDRVYGTSGIAPTINTGQRGNAQPKIVAQRGRYNADGKTEQQLEPRSDDVSNTLTAVQKDNMVMIPEATKKGYAEATPGQAINLSVPNSKTRRGRVSDIAPTLDTGMQIHTLVDDTYGTGLREYKDTAPTLRSNRYGLKVSDDIRIRRLTPKECERLQGFPDDHTKYGKDGELISDTQRYKMCGNAVTTNVVQAVFERIFESTKEANQ